MLAIDPINLYLICMSKQPRGSYEARIRHGWLMYLLAELETAIERDAPKWDADAAKDAQRRLNDITAKVREVVARIGGG
jgi:hypothetical protein